MADGKLILSVCCAAHKRVFINITDSAVQVCIFICCVLGKYSLNDSGEKVKKVLFCGRLLCQYLEPVYLEKYVVLQ